jgi:hypothetical protein
LPPLAFRIEVTAADVEDDLAGAADSAALSSEGAFGALSIGVEASAPSLLESAFRTAARMSATLFFFSAIVSTNMPSAGDRPVTDSAVEALRRQGDARGHEIAAMRQAKPGPAILCPATGYRKRAAASQGIVTFFTISPPVFYCQQCRLSTTLSPTFSIRSRPTPVILRAAVVSVKSKFASGFEFYDDGVLYRRGARV